MCNFYTLKFNNRLSMKPVFTLLCFLLVATLSNAQLLSWFPSFIQESSSGVTIVCDGSKGNRGLNNYNPNDVFVHIGVITNKSTSSSNWKYTPFTWGTTNVNAKAQSLGGNQWAFTINSSLRTFFGITDPTETITHIAILFRSGNGNLKAANIDGSDMYIPVYNNSLQVRLDEPFKQPMFIPTIEPITKNVGDAISISAYASQSATIRIFYNGNIINTTTGTSATINTTVTVSGNQEIVAQATVGANVKSDTIKFVVASSNTVAALPQGIVDGINYDPNDATSATLVLYAPNKNNIFVVGDFNDWKQSAEYQMNITPDGLRYWKKITGLTPGVEYGYQFLIDGTLKVPDYNTEKVLDPWNDQFIPSTTYPNLKPYPTGKTTGIVSILQTNKPNYNWQVPNFTRPNKQNLLVYELLIRDFDPAQTYQKVIDSLPYLKRLGINTIELMPVFEFEGNNSWGYNTTFYFAPDKNYGTENDLRRFVDACHAQGIAVVVDIALNHSFGQSPMVQMYWDGTRPAANSPWFYPNARHPFNVGFDINHNTQASRDFVDRVVTHWLTKYKIDGFRWDLSKGFTSDDMNTTDINTWSSYSQGRIDIWKRIYDKMQAVSPNSYCILEHLGSNGEEAQLGNYGMLLWGKMTEQYNQATMGFTTGSDFSSGIDRQFWSQRNLITYQESHDEERLAYKNKNFGNTATDIRTNLATSMQRNAAATAIFSVIPGPKMIWQFGEVGYDYSINHCQNNTVSENCRTDMKPIRWDYYQDASRRSLYDVYSKLFTLRNMSQYVPTFTNGSVTNNGNATYDLGGAVKQIRVFESNLSVVAFANFGTSSQFVNISFPTTGNYFKYVSSFSGSETINVTNSFVWGFNLNPGDYAVFTSKDINASALPVSWLGFTANKGVNNTVNLVWKVSNQVNNNRFEIERSSNGTSFSTIGTIASNNTATTNTIQYAYADLSAPAATIYYRIKQIDNDGKFSYSSVVKLGASVESNLWKVNNTPTSIIVNTRTDFSNVSFTLTDVSGKILFTKASKNAVSGEMFTIPTQQLSKGVYVLNIQSNKGNKAERIVIQ